MPLENCSSFVGTQLIDSIDRRTWKERKKPKCQHTKRLEEIGKKIYSSPQGERLFLVVSVHCWTTDRIGMNSHLIVRDLVKKTEECVNIPEHGQLPNGSSYTSFCMTKSLHCPSSSCCSSFTSHFVAPIPLFFLLPVVLSTSFSPSRKLIELSLLFLGGFWRCCHLFLVMSVFSLMKKDDVIGRQRKEEGEKSLD